MAFQSINNVAGIVKTMTTIHRGARCVRLFLLEISHSLFTILRVFAVPIPANKDDSKTATIIKEITVLCSANAMVLGCLIQNRIGEK